MYSGGCAWPMRIVIAVRVRLGTDQGALPVYTLGDNIFQPYTACLRIHHDHMSCARLAILGEDFSSAVHHAAIPLQIGVAVILQVLLPRWRLILSQDRAGKRKYCDQEKKYDHPGECSSAHFSKTYKTQIHLSLPCSSNCSDGFVLCPPSPLRPSLPRGSRRQMGWQSAPPPAPVHR